MPYAPRKVPGKRRWAITNTDTGRVAGYSTSKRKAAISSNIRNHAHRPRRRR